MIARLRESAAFYATALTFFAAVGTWLVVVHVGRLTLGPAFIGFAVTTGVSLLFTMRFEAAGRADAQAEQSARQSAELAAVRAELSTVAAELAECRREGQKTHSLVNGARTEFVERIAQLTAALVAAGEPVPPDRTGDGPDEGGAV